MGDVTSQERYKTMIDATISPRLRELGLKGSGGKYELTSKTHWALLGFQKSVYSDRQAIRFTVNLVAVTREAWEHGVEEHPHWGKRTSSGGMIYGAAVPIVRIGQAAGREDIWWEFRAVDDIEATAAEVRADIEEFGLPWLHEHMQ